MTEENYEGCYGPILSVSEIAEHISEVFKSDEEAECLRPDQRFSTVIWGRAGVGKTSIIRQFKDRETNYRGKVFKGYKIVYLPLADIEEVGDIIGIPERFLTVQKNGIQEQIPESCLEIYMSALGYSLVGEAGIRQGYAAPDWVPSADKDGYCLEPTIILIDDFNRANLRILKASMPLFQTYSTLGWKLPKGCHIVLSGNPCLQDYQVTEIDTAVLTRMRHFTARFEIKDWASWASENGIPESCINFCICYPEQMFGKTLTNPRTISEAFRMLRISGLEKKNYSNSDVSKIRNIVSSVCDKEFSDSLISFLLSGEFRILSPEDILDNPSKSEEEIKKLLSERRTDIISIVSERLLKKIMVSDFIPTNLQIRNFHSFLLKYKIPEDIVMSVLLRMTDVSYIKKSMDWLDNDRISKMMSEYYSV